MHFKNVATATLEMTLLVCSVSSETTEGGAVSFNPRRGYARSPSMRSPDGSPHSPRSSGPACLLLHTTSEGPPARPAWPAGTTREEGWNGKADLRGGTGWGGVLSQKKQDIKGGSGFSPLLVHVPV